MMKTDLLVIGSGPAGCMASIYAHRAGIKTCMIAGIPLGGQLTSTNEIENFPGYIQISGLDLMDRMIEQVSNLDIEIVKDYVIDMSVKTKPYTIYLNNGSVVDTNAVIIATGAKPRLLGIKGEAEFFGKGLSVCATCDAFFCKNKQVLVVGGGNTAVEDAIFVSKFAKSVTLIHRGDVLRAEHELQRRIFNIANVQIVWNTELVEIIGDGSQIKGAVLKNNKDNVITKREFDRIFLAVGYIPNTDIFKPQIACDKNGYIITTNFVTNISGVYAAGDVQDTQYRQAVVAAAQGAMAAMEAVKYLRQ